MKPWRPPPEKSYRAGPWRGMRQHAATATDRAEFAELLLNVYLRDVDQAPVAVGRPGFDLVALGGSIHQLGSGSVRTAQLVTQFTTQAGVEHSVVICGGKFYEYDWATDTITETVTAANFATASITLSTTARCHAVVFANTLIVSDGVNKPWSWTGASGAGGLTSLTNAPVFYGQPWVYDGGLWAIKGTNTASRISVVWSEVGLANTGYEAGGYTNIWDVTQTEQAIFYAGASTNTDMVLVRANSATRITGETTANFQSTANREGVAEKVGTLSPSGMLVYGDDVYWFANDGRIMKVQPGGRAEEIAIGAREYMARQSITKFTVVDALVWDTGTYGEYLLWAVAGPSVDHPDTILVVDPRSTELAGVWSGWVQQRWGVWKNSSGERVLVHVGGEGASDADDGYVYVHGQPTGTIWDDGLEDGTVGIGHTVTTHAMAWDETQEKHWHRVDVSMLTPDDVTNIGVTIETPYGLQQALSGGSLTGGGARFDVDVFDTGVFGGEAGERKLGVGPDTDGRWAKVSISHSTAGEEFEMQSVLARAFLGTTAPEIA